MRNHKQINQLLLPITIVNLLGCTFLWKENISSLILTIWCWGFALNALWYHDEILYFINRKKRDPVSICPVCKTKMWYSDEGAWICGNCNYMRIPGTGGNQIDKNFR